MKFRLAFIVFGTIIILSACSNVYTWSDVTPEANFDNYTSYQIDEQCSDYNPGINPIIQQRIKNAIEIELRAMGYKRSSDADIIVKFYVKNETKFFYENCINDYDGYGGGQVCIDKAYSYEAGTLVIDLFDNKENLAIWHGGASGDSWENLANPDDKINKLVGAILKEYKTTVPTPGFAD